MSCGLAQTPVHLGDHISATGFDGLITSKRLPENLVHMWIMTGILGKISADQLEKLKTAVYHQHGTQKWNYTLEIWLDACLEDRCL